ncbi:MAG: TonB C-terminal domain-containing protein, partial [Candidatus Acidiferrum sp.]
MAPIEEHADKNHRPRMDSLRPGRWVLAARLAVGLLLVLAFSLDSHCQTKESAPAKPNNWIVGRILTRTDPELNLQFSRFLQTFFRTVSGKWEALIPSSVRPDENASVVVRVRIANNGTLLGKTPTVEASSGKKDLDDAAVA